MGKVLGGWGGSHLGGGRLGSRWWGRRWGWCRALGADGADRARGREDELEGPEKERVGEWSSVWVGGTPWVPP